jgi:tetratricopeptide (TPR) repeat protein
LVADLYLARARSQWRGVEAGAGRPSLEQLEEPARGRARADLERAARHLEATLAQAPDHVEGWLQLAEARAGLGDLEGAARALGDASAQDPQPDLVRQRARLLVEAGRLDQAIAALDATVGEGELALRFEAARMLEEAGRHGEAEQRFTALAQSADQGIRALAFFHLGNLAVEAEDLDLAITWYQNALAEDPESTAASHNLATLFGRLGRYAEAATHHGAVRERDPDNHTARYGEALALALAGQHAEARARLEAALERFPDGARYALLLARLLVASPEDAVRNGPVGLDLARRLMEAAPNPEHAETMAMGLAEIGRFEEAVDWQNRVVERLAAGGDAVPAPVLAMARERLAAYRASRPWRSPVDRVADDAP